MASTCTHTHEHAFKVIQSGVWEGVAGVQAAVWGSHISRGGKARHTAPGAGGLSAVTALQVVLQGPPQ